MEKSSFFNSVNKDRRYSAEDWSAYFSSFVSNGVFASPSTSLQVMAATGMNITVKAGSGFTNGYFYRNTTDLIKTLSVADGVYNRIDRIVKRWSLVNRSITVQVLEGVAATVPQAPSLTRNAEVYEEALADIYVGAGVTSIVQSNITDQRPNSDLCGFVTGIIDQFDFATLCAQFDAFFAEYKVRIQNEFDYYTELGQERYDQLDSNLSAFESQATSNFMEWFENLQYVLDGDVAGHLQNEIDAMEEVVNTAVQELEESMQATIEEVRLTGFSTYSHSKAGTVHTLTLEDGGDNVKFIATAQYSKGDTFLINGSAKTALLANGKTPGNKFFVAGAAVVGFVVDDTFYLSGGGGGGSGEQYYTTLSAVSWYQQQADSDDEFWYACDITPPDFDPAEQDVTVYPADDAAAVFFSEHGHFELLISSGSFSVQADKTPTEDIKIFYEIKTRGEA